MIVHDPIQRAQRGDVEAFGEVVRIWHGQVRGFVALLGVGSSWHDEVVQDVFIDVWKVLSRYDGERPFGPWLNGVARLVVRRHLTAQAREREREGATTRWLQAQEPDARPPEPDPAAERLAACLERLPGHARELVRLRYTEALECRTIAERLGRSAESVRMALMRIRRTLGDCVGYGP